MIYLGILIGSTVMGWAALIVQSLAGIGNHPTWFDGTIQAHCPPDNDEVMILDRTFGYVDSTGAARFAPASLATDGASVGSLLPIPLIGLLVRWAIGGTPFTGPFRPAAIMHDAEYARATESSFWRALLSQRRADADRVIFEAARCTHVAMAPGKIVDRKPAGLVRAFIVLAILRIAGFKAWMDDSVAARSLAGM
jgi:hypothetical protein